MTLPHWRRTRGITMASVGADVSQEAGRCNPHAHETQRRRGRIALLAPHARHSGKSLRAFIDNVIGLPLAAGRCCIRSLAYCLARDASASMALKLLQRVTNS